MDANKQLNSERETLFNEWKDFPKRFDTIFLKISNLNNIVQNPGNFSDSDIQEWRDIALSNWVEFKETAEDFLDSYKDLTKRTLDHIRIKTYDVYIHSESDDVWYETTSPYNTYIENMPTVEKIMINVNETIAKAKVKEILESWNIKENTNEVLSPGEIENIVHTIRTMRV